MLSRPPDLDDHMDVDNIIIWYYLGKDDWEAEAKLLVQAKPLRRPTIKVLEKKQVPKRY